MAFTLSVAHMGLQPLHGFKEGRGRTVFSFQQYGSIFFQFSLEAGRLFKELHCVSLTNSHSLLEFAKLRRSMSLRKHFLML